MKSKMLLALAGLLIGSILFITPASAQPHVIYLANGTLVEYEDAWTAEIVRGWWNVEFIGDKVEFSAFYRELNNDEWENSPVGTIDTFELTLIDYISVEIIDDECTISGATLHVTKIWWNLATGKPEPVKAYWFPDMVRTVTIDESSIEIDLEPADPADWQWQDFDIIGSTLSIHY